MPKYRFTSAFGEAFGKPAAPERYAVAVHGGDLATVLPRFSNGAHGSLKVGQVLPGHKVNGRAGALRWEQERQNEL